MTKHSSKSGYLRKGQMQNVSFGATFICSYRRRMLYLVFKCVYEIYLSNKEVKAGQ